MCVFIAKAFFLCIVFYNIYTYSAYVCFYKLFIQYICPHILEYIYVCVYKNLYKMSQMLVIAELYCTVHYNSIYLHTVHVTRMYVDSWTSLFHNRIAREE
jgi:hypothetical protein